MSNHFALPDELSRSDFAVFLGRARRVEDGSVRIVADGRVLAVYVPVLYPSGILDAAPTVLGLRTFALSRPASFDAVVPADALLDRIGRPVPGGAAEQTSIEVTLPAGPGAGAQTAAWAAISPPRGGWMPITTAEAEVLERCAMVGIDEIARAIPTGTGEQIVHRVRSEVWGRSVDGIAHLPAGAAFAAMSLGFLSGDEVVRVFAVGPWTRLSTSRGHVLVKRRPGSQHADEMAGRP